MTRSFLYTPMLLAFASLALLLLAPAPSQAVVFNVLSPQPGGSGLEVSLGDTLEIEINLTNSSLFSVSGLRASLFGYDPAIVSFVSGDAISSYLHSSCPPGAPASSCSGGLANLAAPALSETLFAGAPRVRFAESSGSTAVSNPGAGTDPGLDNALYSAMFRIRFLATALGTTTFEVGTGLADDGIDLGTGGSAPAEQGGFFTIEVVPEPASGTLLLAGLMALGRRRARRA